MAYTSVITTAKVLFTQNETSSIPSTTVSQGFITIILDADLCTKSAWQDSGDCDGFGVKADANLLVAQKAQDTVSKVWKRLVWVSKSIHAES